MYDSRIGRWWSVDPFSGMYPSLSPYNFTANNPILFVDYDGNHYGVKINHETKTVIFVSTVHTTSAKAYKEAVDGASHWNNKKTVVDGYTVSFEINVKKVMEVEEHEKQKAIAYYDKNSG